MYFARHMIQRHYNNETYQLQLDSHHRFAKDWDTTLINMLHSTDAGEMSVITAYGQGFDIADPSDVNSVATVHVTPVITMRWYSIRD